MISDSTPTCPYCKYKFKYDDMYDVEVADGMDYEETCPKCNKDFWVDPIVTTTFVTKEITK